MLASNKYDCVRLPDIVMYGGDTTPWVVNLIKETGELYTVSDNLANTFNTASLYFMPYGITTGAASDAYIFEPILTVEGSMETDDDGYPIVVFYFTPENTSILRGKYVYQVEISGATELRLAQGVVTIKQNVYPYELNSGSSGNKGSK